MPGRGRDNRSQRDYEEYYVQDYKMQDSPNGKNISPHLRLIQYLLMLIRPKNKDIHTPYMQFF